jgi:cyclase
VLGKPERFASYYYESGADELIYMDVVASPYGRNSLAGIVERTVVNQQKWDGSGPERITAMESQR